MFIWYKYDIYCLSFYYSIGGDGRQGFIRKIYPAKPVKIDEKFFIDGLLELTLFC